MNLHRMAIPVLGQRAAQLLDETLMSSPGFSIDQLMELAGLSVACAIASVWPLAFRILVVCGPGNNGGDALVASRHLKHFGYSPTILYPRPPKGSNMALYSNLLAQCSNLSIPIIDKLENIPENISSAHYDGIIDGVFGFSFNSSGGIRPPFDSAIQRMINAQSSIPVASIDVPSGWDVGQKSQSESSGPMLSPDILVSLTAPKICAMGFSGKFHFLGGRFLTPYLTDLFSLANLPEYAGVDQFTQIPTNATFQIVPIPDKLRFDQCAP